MSNILKRSRESKIKHEPSAVSKVQMSGLQLVRKRKSRGRRATMRDLAKLNWEPWERTDKPGPSAETMNYLGFYSRVSAVIMTQTKAELMEIHTKLEHEEIDKMVAGLIDTAEMLKGLASVAESAYLRTLASASAHYLTGEKFKGAQNRRTKRALGGA
jgi:hypothetical protein